MYKCIYHFDFVYQIVLLLLFIHSYLYNSTYVKNNLIYLFIKNLIEKRKHPETPYWPK